MKPPHIAVGEGQVAGFLEPPDPTLGFCIVVHPLNLERGQLPQLYGSDGRDDMVFNHIVVIVGRAGTNIGFTIGFKPQPAPLG